jgi:hypothetical protein
MLRDLGLVLVLACALGVNTWETVHTVTRLWEKVEGLIERKRAPLPGEHHDAQASVPARPEKADDPVTPVTPVRPEEKEADEA